MVIMSMTKIRTGDDDHFIFIVKALYTVSLEK